MIKKLVSLSTLFFAVNLCAVSLCPAQQLGSAVPLTPPTAQSRQVPPTPGHYRLTFVVTDPSAKVQQRTFSFDVKVTPQNPGEGAISVSSTPNPSAPAAADTAEHISFTCSDVHQTATGLEAQVAMEMGRVLDQLAPGTNERIHRQINLRKKLELPIGTAQTLLPPNPQRDDKTEVTVTAEAI